MGRLLQLLLLVVLALMVWRFVRGMLAPPPASGREPPPRFEPTGRCERCGTHVPRAELDAAGLCPRCRTA